MYQTIFSVLRPEGPKDVLVVLHSQYIDQGEKTLSEVNAVHFVDDSQQHQKCYLQLSVRADASQTPRISELGNRLREIERVSTVKWNQHESIVIADAKTSRVIINPVDKITIDVLWPCPLSPWGVGYRFVFILSPRIEDGRALAFYSNRKGSNQNLSRVELLNENSHGQTRLVKKFIKIEDKTGWVRFDDILDKPFHIESKWQSRWRFTDIPLITSLFDIDKSDKRFEAGRARRVAFGELYIEFRTRVKDEEIKDDVPGRAVVCVLPMQRYRPVNQIGKDRFHGDYPLRSLYRSSSFGSNNPLFHHSGRLRLMASESPVEDQVWLVATRWAASYLPNTSPPDIRTVPSSGQTSYELSPLDCWHQLVSIPAYESTGAVSGGSPLTFMPLSLPELGTQLWQNGEVGEHELCFNSGWWFRFKITVNGRKTSSQFMSVVGPSFTEDHGQTGGQARWRRLTLTLPSLHTIYGQGLSFPQYARFYDCDPITPVTLSDQKLVLLRSERSLLFQFDLVDPFLIKKYKSSKRDINWDQRLRFGALDITLGLPEAHLNEGFDWLEDTPHFEEDRPGLTVKLSNSTTINGYRIAHWYVDLKLRALRVAAGGQDSEHGFESSARYLAKDRPLVINLIDEPFYEQVLWEINEEASEDIPQTISFSLVKDISSRQVQGKVDVLVIDSMPFSVMRVYSELNQAEDVLASYVRDTESSGEWRIASAAEDNLVLLMPPQVIGEETIKGEIKTSGEIEDKIPIPDELMDFRLSPAARLQLDRSSLPRAREIAPWDTRRLLTGNETDFPGVWLTGLDAELLYGMPFYAQIPYLRLTEFDGWLGRHPIDMDLRNRIASALNKEEGNTPKSRIRIRYAKEFLAWYRALMSRSAFFHPYRHLLERDASRQRITESFSEGVQHRLRSTRETAHPFKPRDYAVRESAQNGLMPHTSLGRHPLRGGVDWGFQSENIYGELTKTPFSVASTLAGLGLSPLGGDGAQEAVFSNGKTVIASLTESGRIVRITITRIGRISMLWNRARHVIVIERTVKTPARYKTSRPTHKTTYATQPEGFEGLAIPRKVREYVEVMESNRSYPDFGESDGACGPLTQAQFPTGPIDVISDWGYDTPTGWAMPLAGPVPKGKEAFYPKPNIQLKLASAPSKGGDVWQKCTIPSQFVFYTSTLDKDGDNTDLWDPVPDIDCPSLPLPSAKIDYTGSDTKVFAMSGMGQDPDGRLPDPFVVEPGYEKFSVDLAPSVESVNLMHSRNKDPVEINLTNICLARTLPRSVSRLKAPEQSKIHDAKRQLGESFGRIKVLIDEAKTSGKQANNGIINNELLKKIKQEAQTLAKKADAYKAGPNGVVEKVRSNTHKVQSLELKTKAMLDDWHVSLKEVAKQIKDLIQEEIEVLTQTALSDFTSGEFDTSNLTKQLQQRIGNIVDEQFAQLDIRVRSFSSAPEQFITSLLNGVDITEQRLAVSIESALKGLYTITEELDTVNASEVDMVRKRLSPLLAGAKTRLNYLIGGISTMMGEQLDGALGGAIAKLNRNTYQVSLLLDDIFEEINRAIAPNINDTPDYLAIKRALQRLDSELPAIAGDIARNAIQGVTETVFELFANARNTAANLLSGARTSVNAAIDSISFDQGQDEFRRLMASVSDGADQLMNDVIDGSRSIRDSILEPGGAVQQANQYLTQYDFIKDVDAMVNEAEVFLNDTSTHWSGTFNDINALENQLSSDMKALETHWQPLQNIAKEVLSIPRGDVLKNASRTLQFARAYGDAPIAEALDFTRDKLAYYLDPLEDAIDVTPVATLFNRVGDNVVNALGIRQPFKEIGERFIPDFENFDFSKMLPDFAGLKLENLLPDLDVNARTPDWITIKHGMNEKDLSAWCEATIDTTIPRETELFNIGPITMSLEKPSFKAHSRTVIDANGTNFTDTEAQLFGDWHVSLGSQRIMTAAKTTLYLDKEGKLQFDMDARNIKVADAMQFLTDLLSVIAPSDSGITFIPLLEGGVRSEIALPLPNIGAGAFSLTNLGLYGHFDVLVFGGFTIRAGVSIATPRRPFNISIMFLGGGGWFGIDVDYKPPNTFKTRVNIGIAAGATAALNFGVATGTAQVLFTISVDYYTSSNGGTTSGPRIVIGLMACGEFRILAIVSASLGMGYEVEYLPGSGSMVGHGWIKVCIKICWCFKVKVNQAVSMQLAGSGGGQNQSAAAVLGGESNVRHAIDDHFAAISVFYESEE